MPSIDIHLVSYNSANTLQACLEAALSQQIIFPITVRVIDNGSTDESVAIARTCGVEVHLAGKNLGYAAAHNRLIDLSRGDYLLTLNPDVLLMPDFVSHMVDALASRPNVGMAAGCLLRVEHLGELPTRLDGVGLYLRRNRRQGLIGEHSLVSERPNKSMPIFGADGAAAFYRREMLEQARLQGEVFDSDFWMHKEDVDLAWRAQLLGWDALYVPTAIAHHVRGFRPGQRERVSPHMRRIAARNRYLLLLKNDFPPHLLRDIFPLLVYEAGIFAYMLLKERQSLRAYADAWSLRGKMWAKRHELASKRVRSWRTLKQWFL
ncbi:MAG: glycosyltransferase family 2 protein [Anaerolineae bacterium]